MSEYGYGVTQKGTLLSCLSPLRLQITKCFISTNIVVTVLVSTYLLSGSYLCNFSHVGVSDVNKNILGIYVVQRTMYITARTDTIAQWLWVMWTTHINSSMWRNIRLPCARTEHKVQIVVSLLLWRCVGEWRYILIFDTVGASGQMYALAASPSGKVCSGPIEWEAGLLQNWFRCCEEDRYLLPILGIKLWSYSI